MTNEVVTSAMLTPSEVANILSVNINTVRRWTNKGILKAYRIGTRGDRRFREEDIASFILEEPNTPKVTTESSLHYSKS
jgi:excisionase family DNA binding protein